MSSRKEKLLLSPWRTRFNSFSPDRNLELAKAWLNYDPVKDDEKPEPLRFGLLIRSALLGGKRYYYYADEYLRPLPWTRHPTATAYWDANLPDHCPGALVVYPVARRLNQRDDLYMQSLLVACHHFEYGSEPRDYVYLNEYAQLLAQDLWGTRESEAALAVINPNAELLVMVVDPPYWFDRPDEDESVWDFLARTPEDAIKKLVESRKGCGCGEDEE